MLETIKFRAPLDKYFLREIGRVVFIPDRLRNQIINKAWISNYQFFQAFTIALQAARSPAIRPGYVENIAPYYSIYKIRQDIVQVVTVDEDLFL